MSAFVHDALLYDGVDDFLEQLLPFVRDGIAEGDPVLAVTTPANTDALREALGDDAGRVDFRESAAWYASPGNAFGAYAEYIDDHPGARVRVIGEPVWPVEWDTAVDEWARYEAVLNHAFADAPAWIVCPYDASSLPEPILEHARHTHPALHDRGGRAPHGAYVEPGDVWSRLEERTPPPPPAAREHPVTGDLAALRRAVAADAEAAGLPAARRADVVLAVHELAVNALMHGDGEAAVHTWTDGRAFVCDVSDRGGGLADPFAGYAIPPPDLPHGRGLWLVRRLCDLLQVRSGHDGTRVRVHVRIR